MSDEDPINDMWGDNPPDPTPEEEKVLRNLFHSVDLPADSYDPKLKAVTKAEYMMHAGHMAKAAKEKRDAVKTLMLLIMAIVILCGLAVGAYYVYTHVILAIVDLLVWMM